MLSELITLFPKLYQEIHGRRALLYPIVPRSQKHYTPAIIKTLSSTDSIREKTSKKDNDIRRDEVRKAVSEGYLKCIEENSKEMIADPGGSLVVVEVMLHAEGGKPMSSSGIVQSI